MVEDKKLLENYKKLWKNINRLMGTDFESKATYDDKYINTKIKTYKDRITTNIYDETVFKEVPHKCLSIAILDSVLFAYEKYYSQIFLEECKYVKENIKSKNYINMELESESDSDSDSDDIFIFILIMKNK